MKVKKSIALGVLCVAMCNSSCATSSSRVEAPHKDVADSALGSASKPVATFSSPELASFRLSCDMCLHQSTSGCSYIDSAPVVAIVSGAGELTTTRDCIANGLNDYKLCWARASVKFMNVRFLRNLATAREDDTFVTPYRHERDGGLVLAGFRLKSDRRYLIIAGPATKRDEPASWVVTTACEIAAPRD